jgi:hypothetical protein
MNTFVHAILMASLFAGCCCAQIPPLKVMSWTNHEVSLSPAVPGSRPVHLDVVIPEVNNGLHATVFLIVPKTTGWAIGGSQLRGYESSNHSVCDQHAADLSNESEKLQAEDANKLSDSNCELESSLLLVPTPLERDGHE